MGSIPIARSINPDDSIAFSRTSCWKPALKWPVLDRRWPELVQYFHRIRYTCRRQCLDSFPTTRFWITSLADHRGVMARWLELKCRVRPLISAARHSTVSPTGVPAKLRYEKIPARSADSSCQLARHLMPSCNKIRAAAKKAPAKRKSPTEYCPVRCLIAPIRKGRKKPPKPPAAPTNPVRIPTRSGNRYGKS